MTVDLIQRHSRVAFCQKVVDDGVELLVHVLDAPQDVRRERVQRRNTEKGSTFSMVVPDHVFEMASNMWDAPDDGECRDFAIAFVPAAQASTANLSIRTTPSR